MPTVRVRRTYLELPDQAAFRVPATPPPSGARVERLVPSTPERYLPLFRAVGGPWHWTGALKKPEAELRAHLASPDVAVWALVAPGVARNDAGGYAGFFELVRRAGGEVEILYFGLVPEAIGRGLGGFLLTRAVEAAWAMDAERVILNTCTLDAPQAMANYTARGFVPVREEWYEEEIEER